MQKVGNAHHQLVPSPVRRKPRSYNEAIDSARFDENEARSDDNLRLQLYLRILFHLGELLLFEVVELVVEVLEVGLGGDVLEEVDEVALGVVVPVADVPAGFVHVAHQFCGGFCQCYSLVVLRECRMKDTLSGCRSSKVQHWLVFPFIVFIIRVVVSCISVFDRARGIGIRKLLDKDFDEFQ